MLGNCQRSKSSFQSVGDKMSRIIRTVSLDKHSDELAGKKSNFSAWVRKALEEDYQNVSLIHVTKAIFEKDGICNPTASPRCTICYPYGKPTMQLIRKYNSEKGIHGIGLTLARENLLKDTKSHYDGVIPIIQETLQEKEPLPPPKREKKYVRRFLKWLIEWI